MKLIQLFRQAQYAAMSSRDFLSLLMTKTNPSQAQNTISPQLRETLPIGTLGMDKISPRDTRLTVARRDDNKVVGKGWKIQALDRSVDSILAAATRLEKEIDCETKYWEEILAVDQKGWKTCKLPQERHTLGVRFGFFESSPSFRNRSLAALQRRDDGSVYLDQGVSDPTPKRVLIHIETNSAVTGTLKPERAVPDDAPLESLILRARNTILEEELWHELNREARSLAGHDVRWDGIGLSVKLSSATKAVLTLEILDDELPEYEGSHQDDAMAEAISISMHLLLLYGHRQALHRRRQPPPPLSAQPRPPPRPTPILRPLLKRTMHESALSELTRTITSLHSILTVAGMTAPPHKLLPKTGRPPSLKRPAAEAAIESLIDDLQAEFFIPLTTNPEQSLVVMMRTENSLHTRFKITMNAPRDILGGLHDVARPLDMERDKKEYGDVEEVKAYLLWAAGCAVAVGLSQKKKDVDEDTPPETQTDEAIYAGATTHLGAGWRLAAVPALIRRDIPPDAELHQVSEVSFRFKENKSEEDKVELRVLFRRKSKAGKETKGMVYKGRVQDVYTKQLPYVVRNLARWNGEGDKPKGFDEWNRDWVPLKE